MNRHSQLAAFFVLLLIVSVSFAQEKGEGEWNPEAAIQEIQKAIEEKGAHWTAGMNEIFRLSSEEKRFFFGSTDSVSLEKIPVPQQVMRYAWHPEQFDWRNKDGANWMSPVKNQGRCGSCVAFATIGTFEGQLNIFHDDPNLNIDLSEAHIFFCAGRSCEEGWYTEEAFRYLQDYGAPDEDCFPYTAGDWGIDQHCENTCSDWQDRIIKISCYGSVSDEEVKTPAMMKEQILKGPVAVNMDVFEDFTSYTGGIYEHVHGEFEAGHAVVIVGWDDTTDPPCWVVRNSWGSWGEAGYFRIRMGKNEVGIESSGLYVRVGDIPEGKLSNSGHSFGKVEVGDSEDWLMSVFNDGQADLEIYNYSSNHPNFSITSPTSFPLTIAPNETLDVTVTFTPDTLGLQLTRIRFSSNNCHFLSMGLRGTGVVHNVKANPKAIEETMDEGERRTVPIMVTYTGDTTLTFHVEVLREWLSVEPDSGTIESGGHADLGATFDASTLEPGEYRTNILIKTDDPTDKVVVVPVTLTIMEAAGIAVTMQITKAPINQTVDLDLCIDNETRLEMPITEAAIQIYFDPTLLELKGVLPTPRIGLMKTFEWNEPDPGELILSIFDSDGDHISPGTEAVAELSFAFRDEVSCGDSAWVDIQDVILTDTLGTLLDVRIGNGLIVALCKGDVDANGSVEITDVLQTVYFILNQTCPNEWSPECWAADNNDDGTIDAMDLVGIINVLLGRGGGPD